MQNVHKLHFYFVGQNWLLDCHFQTVQRNLFFFFFFFFFDFLESIDMWCKFCLKISVGNGTPLGHQREWKYLGHVNRRTQTKIQKVLNIRISSGFLLIQKENGDPTCSVSFSIIVCRYFLKWRINVFWKLKRLHQPPSLLPLTAYPTPG